MSWKLPTYDRWSMIDGRWCRMDDAWWMMHDGASYQIHGTYPKRRALKNDVDSNHRSHKRSRQRRVMTEKHRKPTCRQYAMHDASCMMHAWGWMMHKDGCCMHEDGWCMHEDGWWMVDGAWLREWTNQIQGSLPCPDVSGIHCIFWGLEIGRWWL